MSAKGSQVMDTSDVQKRIRGQTTITRDEHLPCAARYRNILILNANMTSLNTLPHFRPMASNRNELPTGKSPPIKMENANSRRNNYRHNQDG